MAPLAWRPTTTVVACTLMAGTEIVVGPAGLVGWRRGWSKPADGHQPPDPQQRFPMPHGPSADQRDILASTVPSYDANRLSL
jgi:hypothetical protein